MQCISILKRWHFQTNENDFFKKYEMNFEFWTRCMKRLKCSSIQDVSSQKNEIHLHFYKLAVQIEQNAISNIRKYHLNLKCISKFWNTFPSQTFQILYSATSIFQSILLFFEMAQQKKWNALSFLKKFILFILKMTVLKNCNGF